MSHFLQIFRYLKHGIHIVDGNTILPLCNIIIVQDNNRNLHIPVQVQIFYIHLCCKEQNPFCLQPLQRFYKLIHISRLIILHDRDTIPCSLGFLLDHLCRHHKKLGLSYNFTGLFMHD